MTTRNERWVCTVTQSENAVLHIMLKAADNSRFRSRTLLIVGVLLLITLK